MRGGRGSYASIHLPNSTAALPLDLNTACCEGTEKECVETESDALKYKKTHTTKTQTSTDMKAFPFSFKYQHCNNDNYVEMLITEEQGDSGLEYEIMDFGDYTGKELDFSLNDFNWNTDGNCIIKVSPTVSVVVG